MFTCPVGVFFGKRCFFVLRGICWCFVCQARHLIYIYDNDLSHECLNKNCLYCQGLVFKVRWFIIVFNILISILGKLFRWDFTICHLSSASLILTFLYPLVSITHPMEQGKELSVDDIFIIQFRSISILAIYVRFIIMHALVL